jgi:hypothetical protein
MAKKFTQVKKPTVDKKELVNAIRKRLAETELPQELRLNEWSNITNVRKFLDSHLMVVEHQEGRVSEPYASRLKEVLKMVGIDVTEIAKEILNKTKA